MRRDNHASGFLPMTAQPVMLLMRPSLVWLFKGGCMPMKDNRPSALLALCQCSLGNDGMDSWSVDANRSMQGHGPRHI